jgi:hypothetical protein
MSWWKPVGRLIFLGTLAATTLLGPLTPGLATAIFGQPRHAACGNETSFIEFLASSSHDGESGTRPSSQGCGFDYTIYLTPARATLVQGTNVSVIIFVRLSRGMAGPVELSVRGLPDGLALSLTPSSGLTPFSSVLSIAAGPISPVGSFSIIVTGSSPTAGVRRASLSLTVSQAVHDVAILDLKAPAAGRPGDLLQVNITVASYGPFIETVQIQLLANKTRILAVGSFSIKPFSTSIIDLVWNTAGYPASTYELSAIALPVQGETNLENNSFGHAIVKLMEPSTGPAPSSSLTGLSLGTETVILVSLGEALLILFFIGRRLSRNPRKPVTKTKR